MSSLTMTPRKSSMSRSPKARSEVQRKVSFNLDLNMEFIIAADVPDGTTDPQSALYDSPEPSPIGMKRSGKTQAPKRFLHGAQSDYEKLEIDEQTGVYAEFTKDYDGLSNFPGEPTFVLDMLKRSMKDDGQK